MVNWPNMLQKCGKQNFLHRNGSATLSVNKYIEFKGKPFSWAFLLFFFIVKVLQKLLSSVKKVTPSCVWLPVFLHIRGRQYQSLTQVCKHFTHIPRFHDEVSSLSSHNSAKTSFSIFDQSLITAGLRSSQKSYPFIWASGVTCVGGCFNRMAILDSGPSLLTAVPPCWVPEGL